MDTVLALASDSRIRCQSPCRGESCCLCWGCKLRHPQQIGCGGIQELRQCQECRECDPDGCMHLQGVTRGEWMNELD